MAPRVPHAGGGRKGPARATGVFETIKANPLASGAVAIAVVAGLLWLYLSSTDPLDLTCASVNADPNGAGTEAANAVYTGLSGQARTHTTPAITRAYLLMRCNEYPEATMAQIRDRLEHNLHATATSQ